MLFGNEENCKKILKNENEYIGKYETKEIDFIAERRGEKIYVQVCRSLPEDENGRNKFSFKSIVAFQEEKNMPLLCRINYIIFTLELQIKIGISPDTPIETHLKLDCVDIVGFSTCVSHIPPLMSEYNKKAVQV